METKYNIIFKIYLKCFRKIDNVSLRLRKLYNYN